MDTPSVHMFCFTADCACLTPCRLPRRLHLVLFRYDHCPFCIRVELLLGWKGISYDRVVYGYVCTVVGMHIRIQPDYTVALLLNMEPAVHSTHSATPTVATYCTRRDLEVDSAISRAAFLLYSQRRSLYIYLPWYAYNCVIRCYHWMLQVRRCAGLRQASHVQG